MSLKLTKFSQCFVAGVFVLILTFGVATAHEWMAPKKAVAIKNPVPCSKESSDRGREVYLDNCAACHGGNAEGLKKERTGLSKNTPNLRKRLATHTDGDFFWKIKEGKGEMPSFRDDLEDRELWNIINFLKCEK